MNRQLPLMLVLLPALLLQAASARADELLVRGNREAYWICLVSSTTSGDVTSIRERVDPVSGRWIEIARLRAQVIDAAPKAEQLAVLMGNGEWKLLLGSAGSGSEGRDLPAPYRAAALASDDGTLLALALPVNGSTTTTQSTEPAVPAIYRWADNDWRRLASVPDGADVRGASLASVNGAVHLAYRKGVEIRVDQLDGTSWRRVASAPSTPRFKLLGNTHQTLLACADAQGAWSVSQLPSMRPLRTFPAYPLSDVVMIGSTLRLVYSDQDTITQIAFDDYGAGAAYPPVEVAQVGNTAQSIQPWINMVALTMLTLTMLFTFRQRPPGPADAPNAAIRLAPLIRRFAAGVIDAIPFLLATGYGVRHLQDMPASLERAQASLIPTFIGLGIYLLHVTLSEAIWNRSLGKYLFGLRVTLYDGSRPSVERIILRNLMRLVDLLYIPLALVVLTPMRQRVGDLAARTIVIADPPPDAKPPERQQG